MSDEALVELGRAEIERIGLAQSSSVVHATVVRMPKAHPIYDDGYRTAVATIREWLREHIPNVTPAGRNRMHKYNNQDHSMIATLLAARPAPPRA